MTPLGQIERKRSLTPTLRWAMVMGRSCWVGLIEERDRVPNNLPIDGHSFRRVEVLTGTPRRRRWSAAEKAAIVAESQAPGAQTSEIALRYGLHRNQLYDWRREFGTAVGTAIAEADA